MAQAAVRVPECVHPTARNRKRIQRFFTAPQVRSILDPNVASKCHLYGEYFPSGSVCEPRIQLNA